MAFDPSTHPTFPASDEESSAVQEAGLVEEENVIERKCHLISTWTFLAFTVSSIVITAYRLSFGCINPVYFVHSMVIFADLTLANVLSNSIIFNLSLNLVAITCVILYKCFSLLLIELVETTLMAVLASMLELALKYRVEASNDTWKHHYELKRHGEHNVFVFLIEEFLDGAAGIMYTSFAGLVFAEVVGLLVNNKAYVYCLWDGHFMTVCPA